jgi:hypothetical protein
MSINDSAEAARTITSVAGYGGSGTAIYFGFSPGEWQAIGILGGLLIGLAGFAFNAWLGWRRDQRERGGS